MTLLMIPAVILTDDETALYARMGKLYQRRRRIERALYRLAFAPAVVVVLAVLMEAR